MVFRHPVLTAGQAQAEKRGDFGILCRALAEFSPAVLDEALRVLEADALSRSERFVAPVRWLRDLQAARADAKDSRIRDSLVWRALAAAPSGYCHPRGSVIGTLLEDIAAGLPFPVIKARFDAKLHPLMYQRPQVAPGVGNIAQAERLVESLGIAPSLARRFARLEDLETLWRPAGDAVKVPAPGSGGVFSHLAPKPAGVAVAPLALPPATMTWEKFARTVLPGAEALEFQVQHGRDKFIAFTAAVDPAAPPILKWDREDRRNTVAWYVYNGGSPAAQWGLTPGAWCKVNAVAPLPTLWGDRPAPWLGEGVVLVLDGAVDAHDAGSGLFQEFLRDELWPVRATIEAYSRRATLVGREPGAACGYDIRKGTGAIGCTLRARAAGRWTTYRIDRWD